MLVFACKMLMYFYTPHETCPEHTHCSLCSSCGMQVLPDGMVVLAEPNPDSLLAALEEAVHRAHTVDPLLQHQQVNVSRVDILSSLPPLTVCENLHIAVTHGQCAERAFVILTWVH